MRSKHVLVVDDDGAIRRLAAAILARAGYTTDQAKDGVEALKKIEENDYQVILLDLMMPQLSGYEVIERLSVQAPATLKCIIVLTAVSTKNLEKLDAEFIFRVVRKPFDNEELLSAVDECVSQHESPQSVPSLEPLPRA